ncbi:DUF1656 domain-containing protein [Povalibacter sp.]|uniref:DUF1656 domain-containing protein n=1 Tax=Povalibacter sp. TaxID=1962978 RepID=UPI002F3F6537
MIGESSIAGVFFPPLLMLAIGAFLVTLGLRWLLRRLHLYRFVWHAGLFDTALFVVVLWLMSAATTQVGFSGSAIS